MPVKTAKRRKPARRVEVEEAEGDGVVMRMAEHVMENPAMSGGLLVMAMTAAAIVSNAMFLQSARHPDPLFMTRPSPGLALPHQASVPIPRPRVEPADEPAASPMVATAPDDALGSEAATIARVQRALAGRGYYRGAVDGVSGSRTRTAISAYQKAEGLPVTGLPSAELVEHLRTAAVKPVAVAPRQAKPPVKLPPEPIKAPAAQLQPPADPIGAVAAPGGDALPQPIDPIAAVAAPEAEPIAARPAPIMAAPVPAAEPVVAAQPDPATIERRRVTGVQNALNQMGYGPMPSDGALDDDTINAIRRFELDNGMPITGKVGDRLIDRLISIGAMT